MSNSINQNLIIQLALTPTDGSKFSHLKFQVAKICNQLGLLRSKFVRKLFKIDCNRLKTITENFIKTRPQAEAVKVAKTFNFLMEKKWKVLIGEIDPIVVLALNTPTKSPPNPRVVPSIDITPSLHDRTPIQTTPPRALDLGPDGNNMVDNRTLRMKANLAFNLNEYHHADGQVYIDGKGYRVVTSENSNFTKFPMVSCGSNLSRELILLDPSPEGSPLLHQKYSELVIHIDSHISLRRSLDPHYQLSPLRLGLIANAFIRKLVFPKSLLKNIEAELAAHIRNESTRCSKTSSGQSCIPLDSFIQSGLGVCRHHALVASYLLDRFLLEHENLTFSGKVQLMRDNINKGAHAWVTLIVSKDRTFNPETIDILSIDSLHDLLIDLSDAAVPKYAPQTGHFLYYGEKALANQKTKARQLAEKARNTIPRQ